MLIEEALDNVVTNFLQTLELVEVCEELWVLTHRFHLLFGRHLILLWALSGDFFQLSFEFCELVPGHLLRSFHVKFSFIVL